MSDTPKKRMMSFSVLDNGDIFADFGEGIEALTLNPSEVPETVQLAAITEGLISRARSYIGRLEGDDRTPEKMREQCLAGFDAMRAGTWKIERAPGQSSYTIEIRAALLFRQLKAAAQNIPCEDTLDSVSAMWAGLSEDQKKQVKALPRYQQALATVKAEEASKKAQKLAKQADADEEDSPF